MALTANDILMRAAAIYNDTSYDRISNSTSDNPNWYDFMDDALKQLILVRPDSYQTTTTLRLASGSKQNLPTAAMRLLNIIRNMGTDGSTPGNPIFYIDRNVMDMARSTWHSDSEESVVDNYWFDPDSPTIFFVTPPNDGTGYIELSYSQLHSALTNSTDSIDVKDIFLDPLLSWTVYRAFLIDTDSIYSFQRAQHFLQNFYTALGIEQQTTLEYSPSFPTKGRGRD